MSKFNTIIPKPQCELIQVYLFSFSQFLYAQFSFQSLLYHCLDAVYSSQNVHENIYRIASI